MLGSFKSNQPHANQCFRARLTIYSYLCAYLYLRPALLSRQLHFRIGPDTGRELSPPPTHDGEGGLEADICPRPGVH